MLPNDPRHGSVKGHYAGCREACCRTAKNRDQKLRRLYQHQGVRLSVGPLGTQRRIQALLRLGWTTTEIALAAGWTHRNSVRQILYGQDGRTAGGMPAKWLTRKTANTIARVYDELSMLIPPERDGHEKSIRGRTRNQADRAGWVPPLAWDDIDDPDEKPQGYRVCTADGCARAHVARGFCAQHYKAKVYVESEAS